MLNHHLGALTGWTVGVVALMAVYGALMDVTVDAIVANPDLAVFLGDPDALVDTIVQMLVTAGTAVVVLAGAAAFAVSAVAVLDDPQLAGRLVGAGAWLQVLAGAPFALAVVVTLMGQTLRLTEAQMRL